MGEGKKRAFESIFFLVFFVIFIWFGFQIVFAFLSFFFFFFLLT